MVMVVPLVGSLSLQIEFLQHIPALLHAPVFLGHFHILANALRHSSAVDRAAVSALFEANAMLLANVCSIEQSIKIFLGPKTPLKMTWSVRPSDMIVTLLRSSLEYLLLQ